MKEPSRTMTSSLSFAVRLVEIELSFARFPIAWHTASQPDGPQGTIMGESHVPRGKNVRKRGGTARKARGGGRANLIDLCTQC